MRRLLYPFNFFIWRVLPDICTAFRDYTATVNSDKNFTDADIRNGLEWHGKVTLSWISIRRMSEKENEPSKWEDFNSSFVPYLNKYKNVEWEISRMDGTYLDGLKSYKKPECSQIPQALLK
jgi:hypothetical protein